MPAKILELIDKTDNVEIIRDEIAAILALESARQQELAEEANEDPRLWKLRVFVERSNPWAEYPEAPEQLEAAPPDNVSLDTGNVDMGASNVVEKQTYDVTYNVDCYGYGGARELADDAGHVPADLAAATEAQRAARLARNILMSGAYTYLGQRGLVGRRMIQSITALKPQIDERPGFHVQVVRLTLVVRLIEMSPQVQGEPFELVSVTCKRRENGEIYFAAQYSEESQDW